MSFLAPILIILLIVVFVILFIGFTLLRGVLSIFFPFLRPKNRNFYGGNPFGGQPGQDSAGTESGSEELHEDRRSRKKIFEKEDGEYVDFEECDDKSKE